MSCLEQKHSEQQWGWRGVISTHNNMSWQIWQTSTVMVAVFKAVHTFVAMVGDAHPWAVQEHGFREEGGSTRPVVSGKQNSDMARGGDCST